MICVTTINDAAGVNSANAFYALEKEIDYEGRKFSKKASVDKGVLDFTGIMRAKFQKKIF